LEFSFDNGGSIEPPALVAPLRRKANQRTAFSTTHINNVATQATDFSYSSKHFACISNGSKQPLDLSNAVKHLAGVNNASNHRLGLMNILMEFEQRVQALSEHE
jgi:hypothetical protein